MQGVNFVEDGKALYGSVGAAASFAHVRALGADTVALIPFLWQPTPASPDLVMGSAVPLDRLRAGIRQAHAAGLKVLLKPHIWIPEHWAGQVRMGNDADWTAWFGRYRALLTTLATLADEEKVEMLAIGTELEGTSQRPEWQVVITDIRARYHGPLTYVAHGREEMAKVPFWGRLDMAGVSVYPPLGPSAAAADLAKPIDAEAQALAAAFKATGKPGLVAELGLRSAEGAQARPWESAEERAATPDPVLQARVLALWAQSLGRVGIGNVLLWRWISDPDAGGARDTDFTIQNKTAEGVAFLWFQHGVVSNRSGGQMRP
ncbi:MAG: hypothetical protein PW843_06555 [Azospirillaceae bacterium]|nr:hypothetical protein [Azospirillaceae bacterium]